MSSAAWEQWGAKRPTMAAATTAATATASASAAFQNLLRSSPLVAAAAESSAATATSASLKKLWDSARDLTRNAVQPAGAASPASSTTSTVASDVDALESGQGKRGGDTAEDDAAGESDSATWPLFRRKASSTESAFLPTMSWNTRFQYFVLMTLLGLVFFGMASIFLPLLLVRPSKFALSFTFGSLCFMTAFAMLKGPAAYVKGLLEPKRVVLTLAYFLTLGATLYSCLILGNYIFVVCSAVLQLVTLSAFAISALPGGSARLATLRVLFTKVARQLVQTLARVFR